MVPLVEEVQVQLHRFLAAVEALGVELGEPRAPFLALSRRVGEREQPLGDHSHLFPQPEVRGRRAELLERRHAVGIELEDLAVHAGGRGRVGRRGLEPARLCFELRPGILGLFGQRLAHRRQGLACLEIVGVALLHLEPGFLRFGGPAERLEPLAQLTPKRHLGLGRRDLGRAPQREHELGLGARLLRRLDE